MNAARLGGNGERQDRDFYATPSDVIQALLVAETFKGSVYDPAAGDGAIMDEMFKHGIWCLGTDIEPRASRIPAEDFFHVTESLAPNIVTNPPYELAEQFIVHSLKLRPKKLALLLRANYWCAASRLSLFKKYPPTRILPLTWRPDFRNFGESMLEVAWNVWYLQAGKVSLRGRTTHYEPLPRPMIPELNPLDQGIATLRERGAL